MPKRHIKYIVIVIFLSFLCSTRITWKDRIFHYLMDLMSAKALEPIEEETLFSGALSGMTQMAPDYPYTCWLPKEEQDKYNNELQGKLAGIGIINLKKDKESGEYEFIPIMGMPCAKAGLKYGDRIAEVDGNSVRELPLSDFIELIRGEPNSKLVLTIRPNSDSSKAEEIKEQFRKVEISREMLQQEIICGDSRQTDGSWNYTLENHPDIGYIRVVQFADLTIPDFKKALKQIEEKKVKKLIIDFRGNPGGFLHGAVQLCDLFLPDGLNIVTTRLRDGTIKHQFQSTNCVKSNLTLVILIDEGSASAAEAVSACLQDHHRAIIIGTRSYGKGTVQETFEIPWNMGMLRITDASFWRPSGVPLHRFKHSKESDDWGVRPDYNIPVNSKELEIMQTIRIIRESMELQDAIKATKYYLSKKQKKSDLLSDFSSCYDPQLKKAIEVIEVQENNH